jgi:hypothetical protein
MGVLVVLGVGDVAAARQQAMIAAGAAKETGERETSSWEQGEATAGSVDPERVANPT